MHRFLRGVAIVALINAGACGRASMIPSTTAPAPSTTAPQPTPAANRQLPNDIAWFRFSAEYRALTRQAYRVASERLPELSRALPARSWAVIFDVDETILDNSEYEQRRFLLDSAYTEPSWNVWVNERAATAVPGAPEFIRRVKELGGRVAIVTNRTESQCAVTRDNLRTIGVEPDLLLCQAPGQSDKNPRFRRIQDGSAVAGVPALTVVAWVGDNILDFPGMSQEVRWSNPAALADFGVRYFILPNPMYGSWPHSEPIHSRP